MGTRSPAQVQIFFSFNSGQGHGLRGSQTQWPIFIERAITRFRFSSGSILCLPDTHYEFPSKASITFLGVLSKSGAIHILPFDSPGFLRRSCTPNGREMRESAVGRSCVWLWFLMLKALN